MIKVIRTSPQHHVCKAFENVIQLIYEQGPSNHAIQQAYYFGGKANLTWGYVMEEIERASNNYFNTAK